MTWSVGTQFWAALGNHLWQSTLFALAAGVLTLAFNRNSARVRYWLWLAASVKFLLPFALLTGLGNLLAPAHPSAAPAGNLMLTMVQAAEPFTGPAPQAVQTPAPLPTFHYASLLLPFWLFGTSAVLITWLVRWRRVSGGLPRATPLTTGREAEAMRRSQRLLGIRKPVPLLLSQASLEPGIFGIFRPVLLWPAGISERLEDSHLEPVFTHELWHVRHGDNFAALAHMLVEALFWFHPLVWWMGDRLLAERERACDEAVLNTVPSRQVYAESILRVCEFCIGSPLACVSGVTGADLKERIVHIMNANVVRKLSLIHKCVLASALSVALALPIGFGLLHATRGRAEAQVAGTPIASAAFAQVSVKPQQPPADGVIKNRIMFALKDNSFKAQGISLQALIDLAYQVQDGQLVSAPEWAQTEKFDIDAKVDPSISAQLNQLTMDQRGALNQRLLQSLLADGFKLALHPETRQLPVYELVVAPSGSKLQEFKGTDMQMMRLGNGELTSQGTPLKLLADQLSMRLGRTVIDKTGLTGRYAYSLHWTPDGDEVARLKQSGAPLMGPGAQTEPSGPPLSEAIQQQLGLELQPKDESMQVLVVDHVERPAEN